MTCTPCLRIIKPLIAALATTLAALVSAGLHAAPPQTISYQGSLTNASLQPVNNGALTMTFSLYTAASGGSPLYSETQSVSVADGLFNVRIGAVSPISLPFDVPYFLGISVGGDAEMSPRQPLSSSAYAFKAASADSVTPSATITATQITGSLANATIPAANVVGGVGGSGTVTSVTTGAGLSGGPITTTGTINLAATNRLPTTACAANQVPKWNGTAWECAFEGALQSGVMGFSNVALGPLAMGSATSATNSIAIGQDAVPQGGTANVGIGTRTLFSATTGYENTALGFEAMRTATTGYQNSAVGANALQNLTTGYGNIGIGAGAGRNLTNGTYNIMIGPPGAATDFETIRIGDFQLRTFIAGIRGTTLNTGSPEPVFVDASGQLGTGTTTGFVTVPTGTCPALHFIRWSGTAWECSNMGAGTGTVNNVATGNGLTGGPINVSGTISLAPTNLLPLGACGTGQITKWNGLAWECALDDVGVTNVATGAGLTGGPITATGTIGLAATNLLPTTACANNEITKWNGMAWVCATDNAGAGTVTSVATGAGLAGGPVTASGTINLAATNLLPTTACAANQIPKWNGSAWACAADSNSGGTVTSLTAGAGLTGGTITGSGTINLAATNLLPTTACATNEISKWNGSAWACAADAALPAGGAVGQVLTGSVSGPLWSNSLSVSGDLALPATSATNGRLLLAGQRFLHGFGSGNTFLGTGAGNFSLTGSGNVATGVGALAAATTATDNTASGRNALAQNTTGRDNVALGPNALTVNTTGSRNVAVGQNALFFSTGDTNTALGDNAGSTLTSGTNNTYIANPGVSIESNTLRVGNGLSRAFIAGIRGVTPAGATPLPVVIDADGQLGTGVTDGGGTVTSITTGPGLTGGPITGAGTINLAATNLLPTTACTTNQIAKWNGTAWACAADADTNSGGTVVSVATSAGLTGGTITGFGTIGLAATNLLPTTACAANQIPKWSGSAWACAADASVPAGGVAGQVLTGSASGPAWASTVALSGNLDVTGTIDSDGTITQNGGRMLRVSAFQEGFVNLGFQAGASAGANGNYQVAIGNEALSNVVYGMFGDGWGNTALGSAASKFNTTGRSNTAVGRNALTANTTGGSNVALGAGALSASTGSSNIAIGPNGGANFTTGSNNIAIGHAGESGVSSRIFIGTPGTHQFTQIAGIHGTFVNNAREVTVGPTGILGSGNAVQRGEASVGGGSSGVNVYTVTFPFAFTAVPKVIVAPKIDLFGGNEIDDTFTVTVRAISTTQFKVNVYRVDTNGGGWSSNLRLAWQAWE
jgi:trimeric autotransporter adhesin